MKKRRNKIILLICGLLLVAFMLIQAFEPLRAELIELEPGVASSHFTEQGFVREEHLVSVYPLTGGRILSISVQEGDSVDVGDLLCIIDTEPLELEIAQIESTNQAYLAQIADLDLQELKQRDALLTSRESLQREYEALSAQQNNAETETTDMQARQSEQLRIQAFLIEQSLQDVEKAQKDLTFASSLLAAGAIAQQEYDAAAKALDDAQMQLSINQGQRAVIHSDTILSTDEYYNAMKSAISAQIAGIDVTLSRNYSAAMAQYYSALIDAGSVQIQGLAARIQDAAVQSPVSGRIETLYLAQSNLADPTQPVVRIATASERDIQCYVSTLDIDDIQIDDRVSLIRRGRGGDAIYEGLVSHIADSAEARISTLGMQERRVPVTITPVDQEAPLRPGYDLDVQFETFLADDCIMVPKTAVFTQNGQDRVWLIEGGRAVVTTIQKGHDLRTAYVVEEGLQRGDWIVRDANTQGLKEGVRVVNSNE